MAEKLPTDTERREVAERLRKAIGLTEFAEVLGFNWTDDSDWVWNDVSNLVADLIEPAQDHFADSGKKVDREALLELASGLEADADRIIRAAKDAQFSGFGPSMGEAKHDAYEWRCIARRIREALGVTGHADA